MRALGKNTGVMRSLNLMQRKNYSGQSFSSTADSEIPPNEFISGTQDKD